MRRRVLSVLVKFSGYALWYEAKGFRRIEGETYNILYGWFMSGYDIISKLQYGRSDVQFRSPLRLP